MSEEITDPTIDDPDRIDSNCTLNPPDADGPSMDTCGADAVTYVTLPSGRRTYLCADHAAHVNRFGDDAFADGTPTVEICERCLKPTPRHRTNFEGICEDCLTE